MDLSALSAECSQVRKICRALSAECTQGPECTVQSAILVQLIQVHGSKSFKHILPMPVLHMLFCKPRKLLVHDPMHHGDHSGAARLRADPELPMPKSKPARESSARHVVCRHMLSRTRRRRPKPLTLRARNEAPGNSRTSAYSTACTLYF